MDLKSQGDPKLTSSPSCQESKCGPEIYSCPSHGLGQQLFSAAPPNPSPRLREEKLTISCAPSPLKLLGGVRLLILSFLPKATWVHLQSSHWVQPVV